MEEIMNIENKDEVMEQVVKAVAETEVVPKSGNIFAKVAGVGLVTVAAVGGYLYLKKDKRAEAKIEKAKELLVKQGYTVAKETVIEGEVVEEEIEN